MVEVSYLAAWITWLAQRRECETKRWKNRAEVSVITGTSTDTARL